MNILNPLRGKCGTFREDSKSSNYKHSGQNEVYCCIFESQRIISLLVCELQNNKVLRLTLVVSVYTFYGFSYFFLRQTLRGGREMELRKKE